MKQDQKQRGFAIIETLLIIVVLAILGFTGWFVYHSKQTADKALNAANSSESAHANVVKSFEECKKSPGSTMLLIYPEQCITKDKKTFTDNSQKYLVIKEWSVKIEMRYTLDRSW
jgi:type II secretory pathway pseudopilin PulG